MKTTYYVETKDDGLIKGYFENLKDAKRFGEKYSTEFKIVKLVGSYKFEGFHARILEFQSGRYNVIK